jgi:hypothetical protein
MIVCGTATLRHLSGSYTDVVRHSLLLFLVAGCCLAQPKGLVQREAVETVERYVRLRLGGAQWAAFASLVAWEDEPGWDCNLLVNGYSVGTIEKRGDAAVVPVTYDQRGLYCHDFQFKPENRSVTLRYEVVKSPINWKIKAPEPGPPHLSLDVQIDVLRTASRNPNETAEHRKLAEAMVQQLSKAARRKD